MSQDFSAFLKKRLVKHAFPDGPSHPDRSELKPGERREIAVLFLDLGGFTALSERLDHEAVHEISKGVMDALVDITENYGGYVDKIEGDRIMVLFGARKAGENDSERAVSCGLLMLSAIRTANDILSDTGVPISARIGINSGPVTVAPDAIGHLTAIGRTVNLASRMEEAAEENTILVPSTVMNKCMELFCWEDMGRITLKGIQDPVHSFRPTQCKSYSKPRWERISKVSISGFVGREAEMRELESLIRVNWSSGTGISRFDTPKHLVVHVVGEAGIGKSRLVHEFLKSCCSGNESALVIQGETASYAQPAYHLWASMLRDLLKIETDTRLDYSQFVLRMKQFGIDDGVVQSLPFLAQVLSIKSDDRRLKDLDSSAIALETRVAFRNLLKSLAGRRNLILVLDDLHWIDSTCRGVLEFVLANCPAKRPITFLLISRPENDEGMIVEFDVKQGYAMLEQLTVQSMTGDECKGIINGILSSLSGDGDGTGKTSVAVDDFLLDHSQGNPFFLEELILDLVESGILREEDGIWGFARPVNDIYVPSSLTGLLQSRLDRLSNEDRGSLQKSSVLGFEFRLRLYNRLLEELGLPEDSRSIFSSLERRQFLVQKKSLSEIIYSFRHILIHDTVYSTILESNRKLLHRIAARLLEDAVTDNEREMSDLLAHHWERAGDREKAIHWGIINLSHTVETYQHQRSIELSNKLERWILEGTLNENRVQQLMEVLIGRYDTLDLLGRTGERRELLLRMKSIAEEHGLTEWQGKVLTALGSFLRVTGSIGEAEDCYRQALELHRSLNNRFYQSKVLCNLGILNRMKGDLDGAAEYLMEALELNTDSDDKRTEGVILGNLGNLYFDQGRYDEAIEYYHKALEINREVGDRRSEGIALGNLGNPYMEKGDFQQAKEYYGKALELHREIGNRRSEGVTLSNLAFHYHDHGMLDESRQCNLQALEMHLETGNRRMEAITFILLSKVELELGNCIEAMDYYMKGIAVIDEMRLPRRFFEDFEEVYASLSERGMPQRQLPRPSHWPESAD